MSDREPEHNESTDEEVWRDLVARLEHMDAGETSRDGGDRESPAPQEDPGPGQQAGVPGPGPAGSPAERTRAIFDNQPLPMTGPRVYAAPEEDEDDGGFTPPEPPPLGSGEPLVVLAWIGALGGPLMLLLFAMLWRGAPLAVVLGTIAVFAGSAAYLLFRLPSHRDENDDGAEV